MGVPAWNDARTKRLEELVSGYNGEIPYADLAGIASQLDEDFDTDGTTSRSVSAKLRKMDYPVGKASDSNKSGFNDEQENELVSFLQNNSGQYNYSQLADNLFGGQFNARQIQGKVLSLELTQHVAPAPAREHVSDYSDNEVEQLVTMANNGEFIEDIATALNREVNSIRGKALSLHRAGRVDNIPKQRNKASGRVDPLEGIDVENSTVDEIVEQINANIDRDSDKKTARGVKTMLTRRGLSCQDYKAKKSSSDED